MYLKDIAPYLRTKYGIDRADAIVTSAWRCYDRICAENADEPKAYDMHTKERIYPAIACFQAMIDAGIERQEAIDLLCDFYLKRASGKAKSLKRLMRVPGLYRLIPRLFNKLTPKMFGNAAGFQSLWHDDPEWDLCFDMLKCPYHDKCNAYGCPELCRSYCEADDVCYGDLHPRLVWGRTKTLGKGGDCCDFRMKVIK